MTSSEDTLEWDLRAVHCAVRSRHHFYMDEVERLMKKEAKLLPLAGDDLREKIVELSQRIEIVERHGGDASAIRETRTAIEAERDKHEPELAEVQSLLAKARQCLKWSDMASGGMHWLCFAEPEYERAVQEAKS